MSEGKCTNECKNDCADKCVPFFDVQNTMMHYNWANRRMLIALICVCLMIVAVVIVFASNQTKREQMWQETIKSICSTTVPEVEDGQQNPNP